MTDTTEDVLAHMVGHYRSALQRIAAMDLLDATREARSVAREALSSDGLPDDVAERLEAVIHGRTVPDRKDSQ